MWRPFLTIFEIALLQQLISGASVHDYTIYANQDHSCGSFLWAGCGSFNVDDSGCDNFSIFDKRIASIDTHGNCMIGWDHHDCKGESVRIAPGSLHHNRLDRLKTTDGTGNWGNRISSLSRCETCLEGFRCRYSGKCIKLSWICDGEKDCPDGEDESNCPRNTPDIENFARTCEKPEHCNVGRCCTQEGFCHSSSGPGVCSERPSERVQCSKNLPYKFKCQGTDICIPRHWRCNSVSDCNDGTDEIGCRNSTQSSTTTTTTTTTATTKPPDSSKRFLTLDHITSSNDWSKVLPYSATWETINGTKFEILFDCNDTCHSNARGGRGIQNYEHDISLFLYKRGDKEAYKIKPDDLISDKFDFNADTKIIIHGFWSSSADGVGPIVREDLNGNQNIVLVDWSVLASTWFYSRAVGYTNDVARYVAKFILSIVNKDYKLDLFHCIGHSLGAHVCGLISNHLREKGNDKLGRISGLDPAGPDFFSCVQTGLGPDTDSHCELIDPDMRLSVDDAVFVDILHTDPGQWGIVDPIGHVDFYPDGDISRQRGCSFPDITCSHSMPYIYFAESITNPFSFYGCAFEFKKSPTTSKWIRQGITRRCSQNERIAMGEAVDSRLRMGTAVAVYLQTRPSFPYGCGKGLDCNKKCDESVGIPADNFAETIDAVPSIQSTIVGGMPAAQGEFPWIVSIDSYGSDRDCGGILIRPDIRA